MVNGEEEEGGEGGWDDAKEGEGRRKETRGSPTVDGEFVVEELLIIVNRDGRSDRSVEQKKKKKKRRNDNRNESASVPTSVIPELHSSKVLSFSFG